MSIWRLPADGLVDGVYERVVSEWLQERLAHLPEGERAAEVEPLPEDASAAHLARALHDAFLVACEELRGKGGVERRMDLANDLLARMVASAPKAFRPHETQLLPKLLLSVASRRELAEVRAPDRPASSLIRTELLVNGEQRSVVGELLSEIDSADEIDLLCSFIKWSGFLKFRDALHRHCVVRRRPLRVLTTTYMGATQARAVHALREMGAEVRISYDEDTTRLHAKAWLFRRRSGFDTAYVGSSNLSKAALTDGLEWNVRLTAMDTPQVVEKFGAVFESYWDDVEAGFVPFELADEDRLRQALARARGGQATDDGVRLPIEIAPRGYQRDMLDQLEAARSRGQTRNLVVAATGTGKTVLAAFDYKRLRDAGRVDSLLFVAHREEILKQSRVLFDHVARMRGELYVGGERPVEGRHVFASIQSLRHVLAQRPPAADAFDMVIVDEVHHAAAKTYQQLLSHVRPKLLLGLTATPERSDGLSLEEYFPRPFAAELRVWDAIDRQILVPFNYFALDDGTDLSDVKWARGRYDRDALAAKVLGAAHVWVGKIVESLREYVSDVDGMRALAFCVDIAHARYVAEQLVKRGIPAEALTSESDDESRQRAVERLRSNLPGRPRVLCTVDLFNEGVDIPEIDTVLFLRPTESATVFLQQLGRGLRRAEGKDALLVLDFIGKQYEKFRFDLRYRALTGLSRSELERAAKNGFGRLPAGCAVQLVGQARDHVLRCLRNALPSSQNDFVRELKALGPDATLARFLDETGCELTDLYEHKRSWTQLRQLAGFEPNGAADAQEEAALAEVQRLVHADDEFRLSLWQWLARNPDAPLETEPERRTARMLFSILYSLRVGGDLRASRELWRKHSLLRTEVAALASELARRTRLLAKQIPVHPDVPLVGHARYLSDEIAAAFAVRSAEGHLYRSQAGVIRLARYDLLLTTLDKTSKSKLPHLQYEDYALSPTEFHWQSQASTRLDSSEGRRHVHHAEKGVDITPVLFVREAGKDERDLGMAYRYLGPVTCLRHQGERPISIVWRLEVAMPADLVREARVAVA